MENRINVAELLKECPGGMELDCVLFDDVVFDEIDDDEVCGCSIVIKTKEGDTWNLTSTGCLGDSPSAKCVIFPKGKTTWEGFHRPFKDGDILYIRSGSTWICIYKEGGETANVYYKHVATNFSNLVYDDIPLCHREYVKEIRFATEEEKRKLFNAIKANGYRWNAETKTLETLIKPKFKIGDKVRHKNNHGVVFTITDIKEDTYVCGAAKAFWFDDQDKYELVPNKFDISTLKPFDKVLVRDKNTEEWRAHFFSHYRNTSDRPYICIGIEGLNEFKKCIPFKGNEHLRGKNDNCNDFYKTW